MYCYSSSIHLYCNEIRINIPSSLEIMDCGCVTSKKNPLMRGLNLKKTLVQIKLALDCLFLAVFTKKVQLNIIVSIEQIKPLHFITKNQSYR